MEGISVTIIMSKSLGGAVGTSIRHSGTMPRLLTDIDIGQAMNKTRLTEVAEAFLGSMAQSRAIPIPQSDVILGHTKVIE
jgi:hypothetical protein